MGIRWTPPARKTGTWRPGYASGVSARRMESCREPVHGAPRKKGRNLERLRPPTRCP